MKMNIKKMEKKELELLKGIAVTVKAYDNSSIEEAKKKIHWYSLACGIRDIEETKRLLKIVKEENLCNKLVHNRELGRYELKL